MSKGKGKQRNFKAVSGGGSIPEKGQVEGTFVSATKMKSTMGKGDYYLLELADEKGEIQTHRASSTIKDQISKVEKNDYVRITHMGKRTSKRGNEYNKYLVEVAE